MAHHFTFTVSVEVERVAGKFASRDEISEQIADMLENANYGDIDGIGADGDSQYEITNWAVQEQEAGR